MDNNINSSGLLPVGTILHGNYRIDGYLASGGFGNTYVATDISFDEKVGVKEFFLRGVSQRDNNSTTVSVSNPDSKATFTSQRDKFKKEAHRLHHLDSSHIVHVHALFEENGTAYYVMDFIDGESLAQRLKRNGSLPEDEVLQILPQILDALDTAHKEGIWHLDLKPANIMVDKNGMVKLIDFGASKQQSATGGATASSAISYTNGYAPREQMEQNLDKFGPWTDFYALGATLYTLLTNKRPPLPSDIDEDGTADKHLALPMPSTVSDKTKKLVLWLMETNRKKRPQNVDAIRKSISGKTKPAQTNNAQNASDVSDETMVAKPTNDILPRNTQENANKGTQPQVIPVKHSDNSNNSGKYIVYGIIAIVIIILAVIAVNNKNNNGNGTKEVSYSWGSGQYTGNLKNGEPDGYGVINYYDGKVFVGEFENGITNGHGTLRSSDGTVIFDGVYINGERSEGTATNNDGSKYTGSFQYGQPNGQGKLTSASGEVLFEGTYSSGRRWNGRGKESGKTSDGKDTYEYEGDYKNGELNGKGTIKWSNGEKYVGDWKDGLRTGQGVYTWPEKRRGWAYKYVGGFLKGKFHGTGRWYYVGGGSERAKYRNGKKIK